MMMKRQLVLTLAMIIPLFPIFEQCFSILSPTPIDSPSASRLCRESCNEIASKEITNENKQSDRETGAGSDIPLSAINQR